MPENMALRPTRTIRFAFLTALTIAWGLPAASPGQTPTSSPSPAPLLTTLGPYIQNVGTTNATVCWATLTGEVTITPPTKKDSRFREYQVHAVVLRGLTPGTTYTYQVPGVSGDCTFTTAPKGEHPFSFCVVSDTQNRDNKAHQTIVDRLAADKPDLLFIVGDLVSDGWSFDDWEEFFRVETPLLRSVPCYAVLGNHERDSSLYFQFFALPGNERYYSFNRGAAHFVVLDSPLLRLPDDNQAMTKTEEARFKERNQQYWQKQMEWFKDDLAGHQDAKYVFVFFHYPLYGLKASRVKSSNELRERFGTVLQDYHVTAVFNGHDHHYHREVAGGVHFVDGGAAGGTARPIDAPLRPETVKYASVESCTRVEVGPDRVRVRAIDVAGNTVDEFELSPRPKPSTQKK